MALICLQYSKNDSSHCVSYQGVNPPEFFPITDNFDTSTISSSLLLVFAAIVFVYIVLIGGALILNVIKPKHYDTKRFKSERQAVYMTKIGIRNYESAVKMQESIVGRELTKQENDRLFKKYVN
jgi:hypothetical protein